MTKESKSLGRGVVCLLASICCIKKAKVNRLIGIIRKEMEHNPA